jgi:hypothetical protein
MIRKALFLGRGLILFLNVLAAVSSVPVFFFDVSRGHFGLAGAAALEGVLCSIVAKQLTGTLREFLRPAPGTPPGAALHGLSGFPNVPLPADPAQPSTLGFRGWLWDMTNRQLVSPVQGTIWDGPELRCDEWDESEVIRGCAGIHAHLVPPRWTTWDCPEVIAFREPTRVFLHVFPGHQAAQALTLSVRRSSWVWRRTNYVRYASLTPSNPILEEGPESWPTPSSIEVVGITGIVERVGRFVLGTEGWRAEWAVIRTLKAPTQAIGLQLEKAFPDVQIIYPEEN